MMLAVVKYTGLSITRLKVSLHVTAAVNHFCSDSKVAEQTENRSNKDLVAYSRHLKSTFNSKLPVEEAYTPPALWYTDPLMLKLEKETIFARNWIAVARADQLEKPGQYVTGSIGDEPYIVTRAEDGRIRAFYNVCRHHATVLLDDPQGSVPYIECPYHGWTYNLQGRLTKATRLRGIKDFSAKDYGLKSIMVDSWGPLIFIKLPMDVTTIPPHVVTVQETLLELEKQLNNMTNMATLDEIEFVERRSYDIGCNWKVFVDNYLDGGYHIPYAHKALAGALEEDTYKLELHEGFSVQKSRGLGNNDRIGSEAIFAHIYPNLMLNRYGPWLDVNYVFPTGPQTCQVMFDWFLDTSLIKSLSEDNLRQRIDADLTNSEQVQNEDITLCERVQKGLRSRSYTVGRYAPKVEYLDHDFHLRLYNELTNY